MCNASNHRPGCMCGFGGYSYSPPPPPVSKLAGTVTRWQHRDDFCRPTSCPLCGASVYFIRHNGGGVWLDELGDPWPKHPCFVTPPIYKARLERSLPPVSSSSLLLGVIVETEIHDPGKTGRIVVQCHNNTTIDRIFNTTWDLVSVIGRLVTVRTDENSGNAVLLLI